jgi:2-polyprenyl-6-methoxyphenol hydroxylase-like FAD-dependent oxidoreductase
VVWDSYFISMEKQKRGWLVHFKNGSSAYADLVVGADGAHSKIRPYITDIKAVYSGITMVEINIEMAATSIPDIFRLLDGGKIIAFGNGRCLLGGQKGDGGLGFYASFRPDENWPLTSGLDFSDKLQMLAWFKNEYSQWSTIWYELFEKSSLPIIPRPIYCIPFDQTWEARPDLTLLGDAAHVMPPFAGEGANTAMFDALELSDCLTSGKNKTLLGAISSYENSMRKRAAKAAKQSLENGERMHSEGALDKMKGIFGIK